jgi:hypothetical protein
VGLVWMENCDTEHPRSSVFSSKAQAPGPSLHRTQAFKPHPTFNGPLSQTGKGTGRV